MSNNNNNTNNKNIFSNFPLNNNNNQITFGVNNNNINNNNNIFSFTSKNNNNNNSNTPIFNNNSLCNINNNNNIFKSSNITFGYNSTLNSNNNNIFSNNNNNNIFNSNNKNILNNSNNIFNNNIFNNNNINTNNIFNTNNNNLNNNIFNSNSSILISNNESMDNIQIYSSNINNIFDSKKIDNEKNSLTKTVPLSQILSEHFNKQNDYNFDNESLEKINDEGEGNYCNNNYKLYYNYKEELNKYKRKRKEEEKKRKSEKEKEKEYLNNLKILYEKNNKDKIKELIYKNKSKKNPFDYKNINNNNNKINSKKEALNINKEKKEEDKKENEQKIIFKNSNNIKLNDQINFSQIKKEEEEKHKINKELNNKEIIDDDNNFIYEIILSLIEDNQEIFTKIISVGKSDNYELNLDYIFSISSSILNKKKINYKYGLSFKLGYLYLREKVGSINLLNYDILSVYYKDEENKIKKRINMEISIIKENSLTESELCLNPQLFCKLTKNYKITPSLNIINKYNLFKYDKGIKIDMKYISIIFDQNKSYDLTFVNFDEFSYNEDTEIFFDKKNFDKENSTLLKLSEKEITLIYKGINTLYEEKIKDKIINYLNRRYKSEKYELIESNVFMATKIENLLISEEQSKFFYEDFKKSL